MDSKEITARICAAVVGATLALAGAGKVTSWNLWRANARQQHLWTAIAVAVPVLELVLGAALLVLKPTALILKGQHSRLSATGENGVSISISFSIPLVLNCLIFYYWDRLLVNC